MDLSRWDNMPRSKNCKSFWSQHGSSCVDTRRPDPRFGRKQYDERFVLAIGEAGVGRGLHEFQSTSYLVHERASSASGSWSSGPPWRGQYTLRPTSDNTLSGSFEAYCSFVRTTIPAIRTWTSSWKVWGLTRPWITSEDCVSVVQTCREENMAWILGRDKVFQTIILISLEILTTHYTVYKIST